MSANESGPVTSRTAYEILLAHDQSTDLPFNLTYEARLVGFAEGWAARQPEIDRLNFTADRLYGEMTRRLPVKQPDLVPFATLQQIRDDIYNGRVRS